MYTMVYKYCVNSLFRSNYLANLCGKLLDLFVLIFIAFKQNDLMSFLCIICRLFY